MWVMERHFKIRKKERCFTRYMGGLNHNITKPSLCFGSETRVTRKYDKIQIKTAHEIYHIPSRNNFKETNYKPKI